MRNTPSIFHPTDHSKTKSFMIKNMIVCLLVMLPLVQLEAQREYLPTAGDLTRFHTTKTYVVLSDNAMADYNFEIRDAIEELLRK